MLQIGHNFHFNNRIAYCIINGWKILQFQVIGCGVGFLILIVIDVACVAAVSFPFQAGIEHASEKAGERRSTPGVSKILGRSGEVVSEKGERVGAFAHEREATVQFDWLSARQSKYVIRNSAFEGVFEVSVQETSKDLFQYGNLVVLKQ